MKKFLIALCLIIALLLVAMVALPSLVPASVYKDKITQQVSSALGRAVTIDGDVKLSVLPRLEAKAMAVTIANPDGFTQDVPFMQMRELSARIKLLPLLSKRVEIVSFNLVEPEITLIRDKDGYANWEFEAAKAPKGESETKALETSIGAFKITNGSISYQDAQSGMAHKLRAVNMTVAMPALDETVNVNGAFTLDGIEMNIKASLDTPRSFTQKQAAPFTLALSSPLANLTLDGTLAARADGDNGLALTTHIDLQIKDMASAIEIANFDIPYAQLAQSGALKGQLTYGPEHIKLTGAALSMAGLHLSAQFHGKAETRLGGAISPKLDGKLSVDITDARALMKAIEPNLEGDIKGATLIETAEILASISGSVKALSISDVKLKASGAAIDAAYQGDVTLGETPKLGGNFTADITDMQAIAKALNIKHEAIGLISHGNAQGVISGAANALSIAKLDVDIGGSALTAKYQGDISLGGAPALSGNFTANILDMTRVNSALSLTHPALALISTGNAKGNISGAFDALSITALEADISGSVLTASYSGDITTGTAPSLGGEFTANITAPKAALTALGIEHKALTALSNIRASGSLKGPVNALSFSNLDAALSGDGLKAHYAGAFSAGARPRLDGDLTAHIDSLKTLSQSLDTPIAYADIAGGFTTKGHISGPLSAPSITALDAQLMGGLLTAQIDNGAARLGEALTLSGKMELATASVRALAAATGIALPAQNNGQAYGPFSLSGTVSGSAKNIKFDDAALSFDAISGQGAFGLSLSSGAPNLTGNLALSGLDLTPYTGHASQQERTGGIKPWSKSPLDFSPLRAVNATLTLTTPNVITNRLTLGESNIDTVLADGKLTAKIPNAQLYSGEGDVTFIVDGAALPPAVSLDIALKSLSAPQLFGAAADFDKVTGDTDITFSITGAGHSQSALMQNLSGGGNFLLSDGELSGVDLKILLSGIEDAWKTRTVPGGIGAAHKTQFDRIRGLFKISGGIVSLDEFNLRGKGIGAQGAGTLDIGHQHVDFSLRPHLAKDDGTPKSDGLAGYGIPLRLSGDFGAVRPSLDKAALAEIMAERARIKAQEALGGILGGGITDIFGGNNPFAPTPIIEPEPQPEEEEVPNP
ncbi:MAG: AsmA family protein [Robiginitomaculum sp.]